jgi:ketosteroid isomerase-like protein
MPFRPGPVMKYMRLGALVAMVAAWFLASGDLGSQGNGKKNDQNARQLKDLDQQWLHAATTKHTEFLAQLFTDGMFEVGPDGHAVSGAEMRKGLADPNTHLDIVVDEVEIRGIYGDTAVLTDRTTLKGTSANGPISGQYRVTRVFKQLNGKWRAIGASMVPLKQ